MNRSNFPKEMSYAEGGMYGYAGGGMYGTPYMAGGGLYTIPQMNGGGMYGMPEMAGGGMYTMPYMAGGGMYGMPYMAGGGITTLPGYGFGGFLRGLSKVAAVASFFPGPHQAVTVPLAAASGAIGGAMDDGGIEGAIKGGAEGFIGAKAGQSVAGSAGKGGFDFGKVLDVATDPRFLSLAGPLLGEALSGVGSGEIGDVTLDMSTPQRVMPSYAQDRMGTSTDTSRQAQGYATLPSRQEGGMMPETMEIPMERPSMPQRPMRPAPGPVRGPVRGSRPPQRYFDMLPDDMQAPVRPEMPVRGPVRESRPPRTPSRPSSQTARREEEMGELESRVAPRPATITPQRIPEGEDRYRFGDRPTEEEERMSQRFGTRDEFGDPDESERIESIRAIQRNVPKDDITSIDNTVVESVSPYDPSPPAFDFRQQRPPAPTSTTVAPVTNTFTPQPYEITDIPDWYRAGLMPETALTGPQPAPVQGDPFSVFEGVEAQPTQPIPEPDMSFLQGPQRVMPSYAQSITPPPAPMAPQPRPVAPPSAVPQPRPIPPSPIRPRPRPIQPPGGPDQPRPRPIRPQPIREEPKPIRPQPIVEAPRKKKRTPKKKKDSVIRTPGTRDPVVQPPRKKKKKRDAVIRTPGTRDPVAQPPKKRAPRISTPDRIARPPKKKKRDAVIRTPGTRDPVVQPPRKRAPKKRTPPKREPRIGTPGTRDREADRPRSPRVSTPDRVSRPPKKEPPKASRPDRVARPPKKKKRITTPRPTRRTPPKRTPPKRTPPRRTPPKPRSPAPTPPPRKRTPPKPTRTTTPRPTRTSRPERKSRTAPKPKRTEPKPKRTTTPKKRTTAPKRRTAPKPKRRTPPRPRRRTPPRPRPRTRSRRSRSGIGLAEGGIVDISYDGFIEPFEDGTLESSGAVDDRVALIKPEISDVSPENLEFLDQIKVALRNPESAVSQKIIDAARRLFGEDFLRDMIMEMSTSGMDPEVEEGDDMDRLVEMQFRQNLAEGGPVKIGAAVAPKEYVLTARQVKNIGGGSADEGARRLKEFARTVDVVGSKTDSPLNINIGK